jgi:hypothetical protein
LDIFLFSIISFVICGKGEKGEGRVRNGVFVVLLFGWN